MSKSLSYQSGFSNEFATEALKGALPRGQNNPQVANLGLYAEQLSGTSFLKPREHNQRTWFYRIRPSVLHQPFKKIHRGLIRSTPFDEGIPTPNQMRWNPLPYPKKKTSFLEGLVTMGGNGDVNMQAGYAVHLYACNQSMKGTYFYNSDGEMLIVPQEGKLLFKTECGDLVVEPTEICIIPRGMKFQVNLIGNKARGYICENYGENFRLPSLGPIGANGLANPRDFLSPVAAFEEKQGKFKLVTKFLGEMFEANITHSPFNVVAWHGNYVPYKYNLKHFQVINTVSFDHPDPSIFTVLTSSSDAPGVSNLDFVIFPERWMVAEHTFRPPYYHRNVMSEFMGLIEGTYDAKEEGFVPGGSSLHNCMSAHGPDKATFEKASQEKLVPEFQGGTLAFMFESRYVCRPTHFSTHTKLLQKNYHECWKGLSSNFRRKRR